MLAKSTPIRFIQSFPLAVRGILSVWRSVQIEGNEDGRMKMLWPQPQNTQFPLYHFCVTRDILIIKIIFRRDVSKRPRNSSSKRKWLGGQNEIHMGSTS